MARRFTRRRFSRRPTAKRRVIRRKRSFKPRARGRFGNPKALGMRANYASGTETLGSHIDIPATPDEPAFINNSMSEFERAALIIDNYRFYRITYISYTYEALYDQFNEKSATAGTYTGNQLPQVYFLMCRDATDTYATSAAMETAGVRPRKFDRNLTFKYKPNTLGATNIFNTGTAGYNGILPKISFNDWIPTQNTAGNANNLNALYNGHLISFTNIPTATRIFYKVTIHWEAKEPNFPAS